MKRVKNSKPRTLEGGPFYLPVTDDTGQPVIEDGKAKSIEGDLREICRMLVKFYPRDHMTMENIRQGQKLWDACDASDGEVIVMEEGVHDWLRAQLKDDKVGVQMLGMNLMKVLDAIDLFVPKDEC